MAFVELTDKRSRKAKHFYDAATEQYQVVLTIHDQHYQDASSQWQDVNEALVTDGADGFAKKCDTTQHVFRVGNGGERRWYPRRNVPAEYVAVTNIQYWRTTGGGSWRNLNLPTPVWRSNGADWDLPNLYASITNTWRRIKTEFSLKDATAPTRLRFAVTFVGLTLDGWNVKSGTEIVGYINPPTAEDANGAAVPVSATYDGTYIEWSADTTGATFPVHVDPTFTDGYGGDIQTYLDTYVDSGNPDTNSGGGTELYLGYTGNINRPLIKFDVSSLEGSTINSATLYLTPSAVDSPGTVDGYNILAANSAWTEAGATWNHAVGTTDWAGGHTGCGTSGTDHTATELFADINAWVTGTTKEITLVTAQVTAWLSGNYGFIIRAQNESTWNAIVLASSDHATTGYRPKLVVLYTEATTRRPRHNVHYNELFIY